MRDVARTLYFQIGWMIIDLSTGNRVYAAEVVHEHFGNRSTLLPVLDASRYPDERFFYKRYRGSLARRTDLAMAASGHTLG